MRLRPSSYGLCAGRTRGRAAQAHARGAIDGPGSEDFNASRPVVLFQRPVAPWLSLMLVGLLLASCKMTIPPPGAPAPAEDPSGIEAPPPAAPLPDEDAAFRRQQAAAALCERGRRLMAEGRVDPAMRLFEQALSLAPRFGPGYYYLAEAWFTKRNWSQARAFNRQAALYLEDSAAWVVRISQQRRRIDRAGEEGP